MRLPERPRGVRIELPTGDKLDIAALRYDGETDNGVHRWVGVSPVELVSGMKLHVDILPARTSVTIAPPTQQTS